MILAYRTLGIFLYPMLIVFLYFRVIFKKEDPKRFKEKIFVSHFNVVKKNNLKLIWFHAASIGEFKSIIPIIEQINSGKKNFHFLVTTSTLSSGNLAKIKFKNINNIYHRFFPLDVDFLMDKFLNLWQPEKIFLVDSEIWPNLILKAKKKKIPLALINARLTSKSFKRWIKFSKTAEKIFSIFDLCLCSNKETKNFLEKLHAKNTEYNGNIKLIDSNNIESVNDLNSGILSKKRLWVAASIHKGEDLFCLKTHMELKKKYSDAIMIIAPRHIENVKKINSLFINQNFKTQILNQNDKIAENAEVVIINSFGNLHNYFKYAKSVFIGKSTLKKLKYDSGQNPIEAARLNCKVYHGPYISNFRELYEILERKKISYEINDFKDLSKNLILDFKEPGMKCNSEVNYIKELGESILAKTMGSVDNFLKNETN